MMDVMLCFNDVDSLNMSLLKVHVNDKMYD
jgi:hypothetical protein